MTEPRAAARPRIASGFFLGVCGIGVIFVLAMRGLLRPMLPILLLVGVVLIVRRIWKAIRAPVDD